jgi:hypothetical protein
LEGKDDASPVKGMLCLCLVVALAAAAGCRMPSERAAYQAAREAVRTDSRLPPNAVLHDIDHVTVSVLKNAGRVDFTYDFTSPSGERKTDGYVVWLKRLGRRWVVDRLEPTPHYSPGA